MRSSLHSTIDINFSPSASRNVCAINPSRPISPYGRGNGILCCLTRRERSGETGECNIGGACSRISRSPEEYIVRPWVTRVPDRPQRAIQL